jgi:hypothetical protein
MPMRRTLFSTGLRFTAGAALASAALAAPAFADMQGHAITYHVTVQKPPANTWTDAQLSVTLSKTCEGWSYSSALLYGIERDRGGARDPKVPLGPKADSYQEVLKLSEKPDGRSLTYEARYIANTRSEEVRGSVTLGEDGSGTLEVKSARLPRNVDLPKETILPMALRARLTDRLASAAGTPAPPELTLRTIELGRFYTGVEVTLAPAPPLPPLPVPKGAQPLVVRSPLLEGRSRAFQQTSKSLSERMASHFELNEHGVVPRFTFMREGIVWRADVKEITAFASPACNR